MIQRDPEPSPDRHCAPKRPPRVRYEVFQVHGSWHHVQAAGRGWVPPVDLYETETELILDVNLSGVDPEQVQIHVDGERLRLRGQRPEQNEPAVLGYHIMELERGVFERTIELPVAVESASARAVSEHGLLTIRMTKARGGFTHGIYPADSMEGFE
jgi:HSP20 family molecular chaperone IbpA